MAENNDFMDTGRPVMEGKNGAVTSPHFLATQAGKRIIEQGGHAVEAAIAVNSVLSVVIPHMAGLGGDLFALVWDEKEEKVRSLHGSGKSSSSATREAYKQKGYKEIPERGPLAANTVPGTVDAWWALHQRYGKLKWSQLFEDAIHYAEYGFPVTDKLSGFIRERADVIRDFPTTERVFLNNGHPLKAGEILVQPDLAWSLRQISKDGRNAFYQGEITKKILAALDKHDVFLTMIDFANHTPEWDEPISTNYREYEILQVKPNTQGIAVLMMLNMIEKYDIKALQDGTTDYYHLLAETSKLKFQYRDEWVSDPQFIQIPYDELLSKGFSSDVNEHFSWDKAYLEEELSNLPSVKESRDTAFLCVTDGEGNCISLIQSIFHEFGSAFIPEGCGFLLQNRGASFSLNAQHPNSLEPNKLTFHTIIPGMALKNGKPFMLFGSMGGEGQPQTQCAMLTRVMDFGYNIQQAIEAPRWLYGRTWGEESSTLKIEARVPVPIINELKQRGHDIEVVENFSQKMGHAQGIVIDRDRGVYSAGADPRGDGIALAW